MDWFLLLIGAGAMVFLAVVIGACYEDYLTYRRDLYQLETDRLERIERVRAEAFAKPEGFDPEFSEP